MDILKLRNGSEEGKSVVTCLMISLRRLLDDSPTAFYELVQLCKNPDHEVFVVALWKLKELCLVTPEGDVLGSIRNVVLSAVSDEGIDLTLGSPVL